MKKIFMVLFLLLFTGAGLFLYNKYYNIDPQIGKMMDSYKNVEVFYNGENYAKNYGENYSPDGYYYGYKWQCVEYVKRFYYLAKNHRMPDVYGHAKDFFDTSISHGELNKSRNLLQYKNGENEKPQVDDLLVFNDTTYGHVVIITEVGNDYVEVIQQNMGWASRDKYQMEYKNGKYFIGGSRIPVGWLRKD